MTSPRFKNDYVEDWDAISLAAREAAGNRCIRCGHPSGDTVRGESDDDFHYSGRAECGERRARVKVFAPCDDRCTHAKDGKLRVLTVHHLDGDKSNNRWWNLLALCQVCHLQIQARVIPDRPWLLEHTAWFKPYVAGFYAFYYGRLEITREDAERELDRFLAMGQPWLYAAQAAV